MWEKLRRCSVLLILASIAVIMLVSVKERPESLISADATENRLREVLSRVDGAGNVDLIINRDKYDNVIGACVLTEAADDVAVVFRLQRVVQTVLGVENERIEVIRMEEARK